MIDEFVPNFDNYDKLLVVDGCPVNDLQLAKSSRGLVDDMILDNGFIDEDNVSLSDEDCFSSIVPKSVQSYGEITSFMDYVKNH